MRIRARLIFLLVVLAFMFLGVFITQKVIERRRLTEAWVAVRAEREINFDKILELQSKSLKTFVYDYTYWDEMVRFASVPDKTWGHENIEVSLATYGADAAWVYNTGWQLVYFAKDPDKDFSLKELPLPKEVLNGLFLHSPFCHFFINTVSGLIEIWGASIHQTSDIDRKTPAQGYFLCSRLWTQNLISELSRLTNSQVLLLDKPQDASSLANRDTVDFTRVLYGWDNQPLKYLNVSTSSRSLANVRRTTIQVAVLFLSFTAVIILIVILFIFYSVNLPLRAIARSLKEEDSRFLERLKQQNTEFGDISRMVDSFFEHKKALLREVDWRKQTQEALNKVNNCFVSFGLDPDKNIQLITDTAGEILNATGVFYNRSQGEKLQTLITWHEPPDFLRSEIRRGQICFDVINNQSNQPVKIYDLQHTSYAQTDPNVKKYNLQSYVSCPVRVRGRTIASLCAVFAFAVEVDEYHLNLLQVLGKAASIEEERKFTEEEFKNQALRLDNALKDALKSREVLLSMLEDNHLNKEKLEQSMQELAQAYSKLKESQEEVLQSAKFGAIGQLASSVAHEVRNPLAIIMQSVEYLQNKVPVEHREVIQVAVNSIHRANTIVGTLLDFSKAKKLSIEPADLNLIINDSLVLVQYSNLQNKVKVIRELASGLPEVLVDRQKIEQVFVNLFLNAMQAIPGEGKLYVRTYLSEFNRLPRRTQDALTADGAQAVKNVIIAEVQDEGVGIAEQDMEKVFLPFFTTKGAMTGIGLGLSVVKDIIAMHKGSVGLESQLNKGTKVTVVLRVA